MIWAAVSNFTNTKYTALSLDKNNKIRSLAFCNPWVLIWCWDQEKEEKKGRGRICLPCSDSTSFCTFPTISRVINQPRYPTVTLTLFPVGWRKAPIMLYRITCWITRGEKKWAEEKMHAFFFFLDWPLEVFPSLKSGDLQWFCVLLLT